ALLEWLELGARLGVALLRAARELLLEALAIRRRSGVGTGGGDALGGAPLALLALGALALPASHQPEARSSRAAVSTASKRAVAAARGSSASRIALTTHTLRAPASKTSPMFSGSIPPMANQGMFAILAAVLISSRPVAGRPSFVGVSQMGPT